MEINLPDDVGTAYTLIGDKILFVTLQHDQDAQNPLEDCDGMGIIYSLNNRHRSYNRQKIEEAIESKDADAVELSYYEHGLCRWDVAGTRSYLDAQWDSVGFAGLWLPDKHLRDVEAKGMNPAERRKMMETWAQQACDTFTQWCNGEVYGYTVELYKQRKTEDGEVYEDRRDYRKDDPISEDSCFGFFGYDYARGEMQSAAESLIKEVKAT